MSWVATAALIALVVALPFALKKAAAFLKPRPEQAGRRCPHCGHEFLGERRYCVACGGQIWDDVLSEP